MPAALREGYEAYRLVLKDTSRGKALLFRVSTAEARETTYIRVRGWWVADLFRELVGFLADRGLVDPGRVLERQVAYRIEGGFGPVVGGLLILVRRSRDADRWIPRIGDLLGGKYPGVHVLLASAYRVAVELTRYYGPPRSVRMHLNPKVLDSLSSGLKVIIEKMWIEGSPARGA